MSRRLWAEPSDAALADFKIVPPQPFALLRSRVGEGHRSMPGCRERCCAEVCVPVDARLAWERLNWDLSGADLVPPLAAIVLAMLVCVAGWRIGGGGAW